MLESKIICIAGKNEIAVNALKFLLQNYPEHEYCVICNKTDEGMHTWQPSLRATAKELHVRERALEDVYDIDKLVFISLEFDRLIKPDLFKTSALFNIHFSILPAYKGMFTSVHPILNGESHSGVTLHKIDAGIDTGEIIDQVAFELGGNTTARDLYHLYLEHAFPLFMKNIGAMISNTVKSKKQAKTGSSYYSKKSIDFSNINIDLNKTACEIHRQFRAYTFREYQLPEYTGTRICRTEILDTVSSTKAGTLVFEDETSYVLSSIDYDIKLFKDHPDAK